MKVIRRTREEVIKRWIAALRSGNYTQTRGALRRGDNYCCLGVLCDLAAKDGGDQWDRHMAYRGSFSMPPIDIQLFVAPFNPSLADLASLNDDHGATFAQIANYIEREML